MASIHSSQNGDCFNNTDPNCNDIGEAAVFPEFQADSYDTVDKFGEPAISLRIGDEYQAELPPLIAEPDYLSRSVNNRDSKVDPRENFTVGLPVPLTRISSMKDDVGSSSSSNTNSKYKLSDFKNITKVETLSDMVHGTATGYVLVPGLPREYWSDFEKGSFLTGLYIFEKDFFEVWRFVETKVMGAILSFYYGEFYGSQKYRRWMDCRKLKSKKGVCGQRIFSGLRQQELLSRLLPRVSEDCQKDLLEVSKSFGDDKMSLADYVSSLKSMVGMSVFVEAVGIGKGKRDLTGMALDPTKSSRVNNTRLEIPTGKACSSLTTSEIIRFLSGDYRLSKARSNDLFWEAVWPRLLARGWHSEQPKNQGYVVDPTLCLVFLAPGVKKFSSRKLVKGEQYFDSVADILSKVAKEPGLIELEDSVNKNEEECKHANEKELGQDSNDSVSKKQHRYLQPRTPSRDDVIKFMVVDTSLIDGKIRELRTLPPEISNGFTAESCRDHRDEETTEESDTVSATSLKRAKSGDTLFPDTSDTSVPGFKDRKNLQEKKKSRKVLKPVLSQKLKRQNVYHTTSVTKRSRILTACRQEETKAPRLENGMPGCSLVGNEINDILSSGVRLCQDKQSSTSSSRGSPVESIENPQTQALVDLNLPGASQYSENGELSTNLNNSTLTKPSDNDVRSEQQSDLNPRRQSTRNRPLTTRAMEALANGYLTVKKRKKGKDTTSHEELASRASQHAHVFLGPNESTNSSTASQTEAAEHGSSDVDILSTSQGPRGANEKISSRQ